jgi:hypothetical protein
VPGLLTQYQHGRVQPSRSWWSCALRLSCLVQLLRCGFMNVVCRCIGLAMPLQQHVEQWSTSLYLMALDTLQLAALVANAGMPQFAMVYWLINILSCVLCCLGVALQEDGALSARVAKYGTKSWTTIASGVEGRSAVSFQHLQRLPSRTSHRTCSSSHACACRQLLMALTVPEAHCWPGQRPLLTAVALLILPCYSVISCRICAWSQQKSCRLRWYNQLCPGVKRTPFSEWEQAVIIKVRTVLAGGSVLRDCAGMRSLSCRTV